MGSARTVYSSRGFLLRRSLLFRVVVASLATDDELFGARLEVFPLLADVSRLVGLDAGGLLQRLGDGVEQFAEVPHQAARLIEDVRVEALADRRNRVGDEEAAGLVAQVADQAD